MKKTLSIHRALPLICVILALIHPSRLLGVEKTGILCFEMGAEVAYYFIKGKVIRYSAFNVFSPPTELQKELYGKYIVDGDLVSWKDAKTKVRFAYDTKSKILAANENWSTASRCEIVSFSELNLHFANILRKNRASLQ